MPVLNIAAYRFVTLDDPASWVAPLRAQCEMAELKGTIIVADEGINLFLAGDAQKLETFVSWLARDARLADLPVKRSWSETVPFARMRVKHKPQIVTMRGSQRASSRATTVRPDRQRAPTIAPRRLAAWLTQGHDDEGRPFALLDTRNAFEVGHGTFEQARHLDLSKFDDFPAAIDGRRDGWRDETIVTFCTGGIRCEKAALYMQATGFSRVLQLDGGILDYFAAVGDAHFRGDCFVFDERVALDADLIGKDGNDDT